MDKQNFIKKAYNFLLDKFFKINGSPRKIAAGIGLGVFSGILPGTGPAAALFLAFIFRANRAAALFAGILTNTWLSFLTFILAIKVGSAILKIDWMQVKRDAESVISGFHWVGLFKISFLKVVFPLFIGYLAIGITAGFLSYLATLFIIRRHLNGHKTGN
jgi:uncharacterized protein (DUF2062 family)